MIYKLFRFIMFVTSFNSSIVCLNISVMASDANFGIETVYGAIVAFNEIRMRQVLPADLVINWTLVYTADTNAESTRTNIRNLSSVLTSHTNAFIGDGLNVICETTALLAGILNVPIVSFGCTDDALSDKNLFPTFTRAVGRQSLLAPLLLTLMNNYRWKRIGIVATTYSYFISAAYWFKSYLEEKNMKVFLYIIEPILIDGAANEINENSMDAVFNELKEFIRG